MESLPNDKRSIFDLSTEEANKRMTDRLEELKQELFAKNLPITYTDENCTTDDLFVHEYKDGKRLLVSVDIDSGDITVVRELDNA